MAEYTFLFTDIEGSTRNWERYPDRMQAALERHDALMRAAVDGAGGLIVKTTGDGLLAVFFEPGEGLRAAIEAQTGLLAETWPLPAPLRVRMGLHTGPAQRRDDDFFGPTLNRTARLMAAGHGGQILLGGATADAVADDLPGGVELRDLGARRLKDLIDPEAIWQVVAPGLPAEFPPLNTLDRRPNNLPAAVTPLVGREREVAEVLERLRRRDIRLVTLTGPGGTGKTRLATQVAAELIDDFADGVFFVNLTPIRDPALVPATIARALGVKEAAGKPIEVSLHEHLADKSLLLLLDNFEQVLDAALAVAELLRAAPKLKVLCTSRAELNLRGEHEYPVLPLDLPPTESPLPPAPALARYSAVALFAERAAAVRPDFALTEANAAAVLDICRRLDGLPLALELAAARLRQFGTPAALLPQLESRLTLLVGGARDLPRHQQTLRDAIAWSHDMLGPAERRLFRRLAVCVGGCAVSTLREIETAAGDPLPDFERALDHLVDMSLIRREAGVEGEPRVAMLETIREYGLEELTAAAERDRLETVHTGCFLALAETAESTLRHTVEQHLLDRLTLDHDNHRAAFERAVAARAGETALRYGAAMWSFWLVRAYFTEGRRRLAAAVEVAESDGGAPDDPARARLLGRVLFGAGALARHLDDFAAALDYHERALAAIRASGDDEWTANALGGLGLVRQKLGDFAAARALYEELIQRLRRRAGTTPAVRSTIAAALNNLGNLARQAGDLDLATVRYEEALELRRAGGNRWGEGLILFSLGHVALARGDLDAAERAFGDGLAVFRELGDRLQTAGALDGLGTVALRRGDVARADALFEEAEALQRAIESKGDLALTLANRGNVALGRGEPDAAAARFVDALQLAARHDQRTALAECLDGLGIALSRTGDPHRALRFFAGAEAVREGGNMVKPSTQSAWYAEAVAAARGAGGERADEEWERGRSASVDEHLRAADLVVAAAALAAAPNLD